MRYCVDQLLGLILGDRPVAAEVGPQPACDGPSETRAFGLGAEKPRLVVPEAFDVLKNSHRLGRGGQGGASHRRLSGIGIRAKLPRPGQSTTRIRQRRGMRGVENAGRLGCGAVRVGEIGFDNHGSTLPWSDQSLWTTAGMSRRQAVDD